jgi:hypothetical protein
MQLKILLLGKDLKLPFFRPCCGVSALDFFAKQIPTMAF